MKSYEVYLTRSCEVAGLLAKAHDVSTGSITHVEHGPADGELMIPETYYDQGYFYCLVERETSRPSYEIIFA